MSTLILGILIGVGMGIGCALVLYALLIWPVKHRSDRVQRRTTQQNGFPEDVLDLIEDNARTIRASSEDIELRISRLKQLQRARERRPGPSGTSAAPLETNDIGESQGESQKEGE